MKRMFAATTTLVILLAFAGCGGSGPFSGTLYPVTGQVLLADGKPFIQRHILPDFQLNRRCSRREARAADFHRIRAWLQALGHIQARAIGGQLAHRAGCCGR